VFHALLNTLVLFSRVFTPLNIFLNTFLNIEVAQQGSNLRAFLQRYGESKSPKVEEAVSNGLFLLRLNALALT
jgi:hypothetical protein